MHPEQKEQGPGADRWMISYADFVTLLFAVFVVLFVSAQSGRDTAKMVSEAVVLALKSGSITYVFRDRPTPPNAKQSKAHTVVQERPPEHTVVMELMPSLKVLTAQLREEIEKGKVEVRMEPRGLVISLRQAIFFQSGQAVIDTATHPITDKVAAVIASLPNPVRLEGHTDNVPIRNSRFPSNWELSAARSIAMLELLASRNKIPRDRLSIAGFAETVPLGSNDDPAGRARNRRVDVVILNQMVTR